MLFNKLNSSKKKCLNKIYSYKINYSGGSFSTSSTSSTSSTYSKPSTSSKSLIIDENYFLQLFIDHTKEILNNEKQNIKNLNVTNKIKIDINFGNENIKSELKIDNNILIIKESLIKNLLSLSNQNFVNFTEFLNDLYFEKKIDDIFIILIEKDEEETKGQEFSFEDDFYFFKINFFQNINFCNILIYNNEIYFKDPEVITDEYIESINDEYIESINDRLEYINSIYNLELEIDVKEDPSYLKTKFQEFYMIKFN